ncbi:MAG: SUMF1/EgtB/PvdO family nonheme iron enzyme [Prosthecobacter sp.]
MNTLLKPLGSVLAAWLMTAAAHGQMNLATIRVQDAGNVSDGGVGSVAYDYRIGAYEVTNTEYAIFLNAVAGIDTHNLWNVGMGANLEGGISRSGSGTVGDPYFYWVRANMGDKPVNFVNWFDAARFCNWLTNGQPSGAQDATTTESGVYALNGVTNPATNSIVRDATVFANGGVALPTADEWYKAAYFNPATGQYQNFAVGSFVTQAAATATGDVANPGASVINYFRVANWNGSVDGNVTTVGSAGATSPYGGYDFDGNVEEWTSEPRFTTAFYTRGGSFYSGNVSLITKGDGSRQTRTVDQHSREIGFRVVSLGPIGAQSTIAFADRFAYAANAGWIDFRADEVNGVRVSETFLSGYAYAANFGWIHFGNGSPSNGHSYANNSSIDYGVNLSAEGLLTGHAYSANAGWITFEQTHGQPRIDPYSGDFIGYAYSANLGWIALETPSSSLATREIESPDSDGDGIADSFEYLHFHNLTAANATTDSDGDGQSDLDESHANTDPTDATDRLAITILSKDENDVLLGLQAGPGRMLSITYSEDLTALGGGGEFPPFQIGPFLSHENPTTFLILPPPTSTDGSERHFFKLGASKPLQR